ncbi:MAG: MiaB/RimO family radical SAM methylthiotransferase [Spirochaetes bacterium]|jgi:threonylcarbamoyladenosine tRNA methylthiotransferase MtaB|nr:MiaB/RimO family radical SAM methylthiotransferase [Spirochaetota bacterium]
MSHPTPHTGAERPRVAFQTLGCKLNQYETDSVAADFADAGYAVVPFEEEAEVYVLNTCTVTNRADRKSRNLLYRTLRATQAAGAAGAAAGATAPEEPPARADQGADHRGAVVVLTGCFAESHKDEYERDNRFLLVDNPRKSRIVELVEARRRGELLNPGDLDPKLFDFRSATLFHTRTTVKVQDGCDNFCTFCIVPYVRGRASSRSAAEIERDVAGNVEAGAREIVLTGVNMSRYRDGETSFSRLVERVLNVAGDFRVRISSLEPDSLDDRFYDLLQHPKMCPHLHLCLQSGSDRILLKMRRQYDTAQFHAIVERIRARRPDFNFTTDIIVGFPGETDADFQATASMARNIGFSHIHTFPYSLRSSTRAARYPEHIENAVKTRRAEEIRRIAAENKRRYRESLTGMTQHVLVERPEPEMDREHGYGEHYVPVWLSRDRNVRIAPQNAIVPVKLTGLGDGEDPILFGQAL